MFVECASIESIVTVVHVRMPQIDPRIDIACNGAAEKRFSIRLSLRSEEGFYGHLDTVGDLRRRPIQKISFRFLKNGCQ